MPISELTLSFPVKNPARLLKLFPQKDPVRYLYLGGDFFARRRLTRQLDSRFSRLDIARLHDEVAAKIRGDFVTWVDELNYKYGNDLEWWFGKISSRNIYNSNLFQYCCYLEILETIWNDPSRRPALVFVESLALLKAICKWAAQKSISIKLSYYYRAKLASFKNYLRSVSKFGYWCYTLMVRQIAAAASRNKSKPAKLASQPLALMSMCVHEWCFPENGDFNDPYFPNLANYLTEKGYQVLVMPLVEGFGIDYFSTYQRMRQGRMSFIIAEDFLRMGDYLGALSYSFRTMGKHKAVPRCRGFDLSDIIREEQLSFDDLSALGAGLIFRLCLRLGEAGWRPRLIIDWYENQVTDKALIAGARRVFPSARIIGAQLFLHLTNYLSLFPSRSEQAAGLTPDLILEMSEQQCRAVRSFAPELPCSTAAALRYEYLFQESALSISEVKARTILVLLPFDPAESVEMLETVRGTLGQIAMDVAISVKCHPDVDSQKLVRLFGSTEWPSRFKIFQGSLVQAFQQASLVITSNSTTIIEAATFGLPVLFLGRQTSLNQKILSDRPIELITECYSVEELTVAIKQNLDRSAADTGRHREIGKEVRELFFTPINSETLLPFLGIWAN